jgi:transcriptional regulator
MPIDLDRRAIMFSLVSAAVPWDDTASLEAQGSQNAPDPSLYIPRAHVVEERQFLHDFMEGFPFIALVTAAPTLRITHIPSVLDRTRGRIGTLLGHISAQNPQNSAFDGTHHATAVFRGPHGYISPSWYATQTSVVPTWNFAVVHVSGRPKAITDRNKAYDLLATLISKNEQRIGSTGYDFAAQPREYVDRMMQGIRPFEMEIEAIEGKFKLGQERAAGDRAGVVEHLKRDAYRERSLSELTDSFYSNPPKS